MKITNLVEQIFSIAVALDQNGGLKNTIYALDDEIFILNYDHTVLLNFKLRKNEAPFSNPIAFKANDYDSNEFEEKDGQIIFHSQLNGYVKQKRCGTVDLSPGEVKELFKKYKKDFDDKAEEVTLTKSILPLLEDGLSHIEFSGKKGEGMKLVQRNIYNGTIIEISKDQKGFFKDSLKDEFGPVGIKTSDFNALFQFQDELKFMFPSEKSDDVIMVKSFNDNKRSMTGFIASCLYDELIEIRESKKDSQQSGFKRNK